jgi:hypothetical protein
MMVAVMLSEAKHLCFVRNRSASDEIESLASRTLSAALQLRFVQNDIMMACSDLIELSNAKRPYWRSHFAKL